MAVGSGVDILPAVTTDAGEVHTLCRAAFLSEGQRYDTPHLPALTETLAEVVDAIDGPGTVVLVARDGHRMVGTVRITAGEPAHLGRLAIAPDRQGEGLGSLLVRAAEAAVTGGEIRLFTGDASHDNIRLYERLGYVRDQHDTDRGLVHLVKRRGPQPRMAATVE